MDLSVVLSFALLLAPVIFQVVYGVKAIRKTTVLPLPIILLISLGLQFVCTLVIFLSVVSSFDGKCALPLAGIIMIGVMLAVVIGVVFVIQLIVSNAYKYRKLH